MHVNARNGVSLIGLCLVVLILGLNARGFPIPAVSAQNSCPPGQAPLPFVSLADVPLPEDVLPYSRMALTRITLQPGETLDVTTEGYTAYYVQSGVLKYRDRPGFAIAMAPKCESPDGRYSARLSTHVDREGLASVNEGEALVSDVIPTGPIVNGGDTPLVMLRMALIPPMIDPETGAPIPDPVVVARAEVREREARREACRTLKKEHGATDMPATPDAEATPALQCRDKSEKLS